MIQPKETINRKEILRLLNIDQMISDYLTPANMIKKVSANRYEQISHKQTKISTNKINIDKSNVQKQLKNNSTSLIKLQLKKQKRNAQSSQRCYRMELQPQSEFGNKTISSSVMNLQRKIPINSNKKRLLLKNTINTSSTLDYTKTHQNKQATIHFNGKTHYQTNKQAKLKFQAKARTISCQKFNKKEPNNTKTLIKDRYQLLGIIGKGLSGVVYQAKDILSDRAIAIKIISEQCKQYQFIKQLNHKNIIEYYNSFIMQSKRYLILQYLPLTLRTFLKKKKLIQQEVKLIFRQIVDAVIYLHSLSIAHRDIKLQNILISDDLIVKFIDFGMCINVQHNSEVIPLQFCGTINYMAPEVIRGQKSDPRKSDIWSLGIILYALAIGRLPFHAKAQNQIYKRAITKKQIYPQQMSKQLKNLLDSMLQKQPNKRISILQVSHHNWLSQS